jgi:hypothetical protein
MLRVSRADVERRNIVPAILELGQLLAPENVRRFHRKVSLVIDGYDDDPRDLYDIAEVRGWVQLLDIAFPFWFYFLWLGPQSSLQWIPFCLCRFEQVQGGKLIDQSELKPFVAWRAWATAQLCAVHKVPEIEVKRAIGEIYNFFGMQTNN